MKMLEHPWPIAAASLALSLTFATPAHALLVTADAEAFLNGASADSDSDSDGSSAFANASAGFSNATASSTAGGALLTTAYAGELGIASAAPFGAFAPPSPAGVESVSAQATWSDTITNNTGTLVNYKWLFQVTNPRLGNADVPDDYAALDIDILLNNAMIWEGYAIMENCILTASNFDLTQNGCIAGGPSFTIGLDLGNFVDGQSFTLDYVMTAFADTQDPFAIDSETRTFAAIGDPFDPDPTAFGVIQATPVATVPAPFSLQLFGIALAGLWFAQRKQHREGKAA